MIKIISFVVLCLAVAVFAATPLTGAIFTTMPNGATVNTNIYSSKLNVYLNGGPQNFGNNPNCDAAGLPDGTYFFQVTDPSGKYLLSVDDITCRAAYVEGGYWRGSRSVAGLCNFSDADRKSLCERTVDGITFGVTAACHYDQAYTNDAGVAGACAYQRQSQLMPFLDTPNEGGVYKAWATRQSDFDFKDWDQWKKNVETGAELSNAARSRAGGQSYGFIDSKSKTDNFKVKLIDDTPPPPTVETPDTTSSTSGDGSTTVTAPDCKNTNDENCMCPAGTTAIKYDGLKDPTFVIPCKDGQEINQIWIKAGAYNEGYGKGNDAPWLGGQATPKGNAIVECGVTVYHSSGKDLSHVIVCLNEKEETSGVQTTDTTGTPTTDTTGTPTTDTTGSPSTETSESTFGTTEVPPTTDSKDFQPSGCLLGSGDCVDIFLQKKEFNDGAVTLTYNVRNRCETSLAYIYIGIDGLEVQNAAGSFTGEHHGDSWTGSFQAQTKSDPKFNAWAIRDGKNELDPKNSVKGGATEAFTITVTGWTPWTRQTFVALTGAKFDAFKNVKSGACGDNDCKNGCSNCATPGRGEDWDFYCVPDGGAYVLVVANKAPAQALAAEGANGCDCSGIPATGGPSCTKFNCEDCGFNTPWMEPTLNCAWCPSQGKCRSVGSCDGAEENGACGSGKVPYSPEPCPNNCSGAGYCNETTGLCVCKSWKDKGLNCGSRSGLGAGAAAAIAGGGIAGIVIAAVVVALIILGVVTITSTTGVGMVSSKDFVMTHVENSGIYNNPHMSGERSV